MTGIKDQKKRILYSFLSVFLLCFSGVSSARQVCITSQSDFLPKYLAGQASGQQVDSFFSCLDKMISLFLTFWTGKNPGYYTALEMKRVVQFMGFHPEEAHKISQSVLALKAALQGGSPQILRRSEVVSFQRFLKDLGFYARRLNHPLYVINLALDGHSVSRTHLMKATQALKYDFRNIGQSFFKHQFKGDLQKIKILGKRLSDLGISYAFPRWGEVINFLQKWKKVILRSSESQVFPKDWPDFMHSLSEIFELGIYYKKFIGLRGMGILHASSVQHTQYLSSRILDFMEAAIKNSFYQKVSVDEVRELAEALWLFPVLSSPTFSLSLSAFECFLLNRHKKGEACSHNIRNNNNEVRMDFGNKSFTVEKAHVFASVSVSPPRFLNMHDVSVLRNYLRSWIQNENFLRKNHTSMDVFGSPNQWLGREISLTSDSRLYFHKRKKTHTKAFLSLLNWQSHLMSFIVHAYSGGKGTLTLNSWNTFIREWTPLMMSLGVSGSVREFQENSEYLFYHGDFLTTSSNGDGRIQDTEALELFSLFGSAVKTTFLAARSWSHCEKSTGYFHSSCIKDSLSRFPHEIFGGFPYFRAAMILKGSRYKTRYLSLITTFFTKDTLSLSDLFDVFLKLHYQENAMEYLDTNRDQVLESKELMPLLRIFEEALIQQMPLINDERDVFAFITYVFYFGIIPVFGDKQIHTPLHFSYWLLHPEKWQGVQIRRIKLLNALIQINQQF